MGVILNKYQDIDDNLTVRKAFKINAHDNTRFFASINNKATTVSKFYKGQPIGEGYIREIIKLA